MLYATCKLTVESTLIEKNDVVFSGLGVSNRNAIIGSCDFVFLRKSVKFNRPEASVVPCRLFLCFAGGLPER